MMPLDSRNKITLVGAGPGDPDLITVRGLQAIQSADFILYDALVHPSLVKQAPKHALRIFVGKRAANHFASQEEINEKMSDFAKLGHVVRLKGGDPFVFGRGYEELQYAQDRGIAVEIVPGLSSSTAVSAWNGLPVTLRGISRSFHVVSAVEKDGVLSQDFLHSMKIPGTLVILMGLGKLDQIIQKYKEERKEKLGIAVIQNGTLAHQNAVYGTIDTIQEKVSKKGITTPAIIYIGEVVNAYLKQSKKIKNGAKKSVISGVFQAG